MISIIVASHGEFAEALIHTSEMIDGKQQNVAAVTLAPSDGIDALESKFKDVFKKLPRNDVLILTDLWGGSPFNAASKFVAEDPAHNALIAGVNLPLLLEAYMIKDQSLSKVVDHLTNVAASSIKQFELPDQSDGEDDLL